MMNLMRISGVKLSFYPIRSVTSYPRAPPKIPKLYYSPTSCGASSFIAAYSVGLQMDCEEVDLKTHRTASGEDFYKTNPKGNVPTIVFEKNNCKVVLNENIASLLYIADQVPSSGLAPPSGSIERYELLNALSYIATEVHPSFSMLLHLSPTQQKESYDHAKKKLIQKLVYLNESLLFNKTLFMGKQFTIADAYLFVILSWHSAVNLDMKTYPHVYEYYKRVKEMKVVQEAYARMHTKPKQIYGK